MILKISPSLGEDQILEIIKQFIMAYDHLSFRGTKLFKGVKPLLNKLHLGSFKLFIVTNKRIAPTRKILKALKVDKLFKDVYAFDMKKGREMKKSEMMGLLLTKHKLNKDETMVVSDNEGDISAARQNGLIPVAVLGGYGQVKNLKEERPDHMIRNTEELYTLILKLNHNEAGT